MHDKNCLEKYTNLNVYGSGMKPEANLIDDICL